MCISGIIYIALAKTIPAEALDTHTMDEQSLATEGQAEASDESPRDGAKIALRWEFCSEIFLVAAGCFSAWHVPTAGLLILGVTWGLGSSAANLQTAASGKGPLKVQVCTGACLLPAGPVRGCSWDGELCSRPRSSSPRTARASCRPCPVWALHP